MNIPFKAIKPKRNVNIKQVQGMENHDIEGGIVYTLISSTYFTARVL